MTLKATWRDGTRARVFDPVEFLAALAVLTPRPEINLLRYHGLLALHARWRPQGVGYGRVPPEAAADDLGETRPGPPLAPRHWSWASLMRRAFAIDVLTCPHCGGRMRVIATIEDPVAVRRNLAARRPTASAGPDPPAGAPAIAS